MNSEKRQSYRYRVQEEFAQATVLAGRKEWPAELINESAGGFLVALTPEAGLKPGDSLTLRIHSGAYLVEVVHSRTEGEKALIGVRRFDDGLQLRSRSSRRGVWQGGGRLSRPASGFSVFGAYAGIALLTAGFVLWGDQGRSLKAWLRGDVGRHGPALAKLPEEFAGQIDWRAAQCLQGINSLSSDKLRDAIGLTKAQRESLDLVFADTTRRLYSLYAEIQNQPAVDWNTRSSQVIDEAVQRVLCTLTDEQIDRWRKELLNSVTTGARPQHQASLY